YSDLPGMTAWLVRLGTWIGGENTLALRMPFLLMGALVPLYVVRIGTRWFGAAAGWHAGSLAGPMPLSGTLGVLALPDAPLALATVLCLHAGTHLVRQISALAVLELGIGMALGALSHYRFGGVLLVGAAAMLCLPNGRRFLADPRGWLAVALGILASAPLALATVLCLHAGTHLVRQISALAVLELGIGMALGALSHYRFGGVLLVGAAAMLCLPNGRRFLADPRGWLAVALGILAWAP